MSKHYTIPIFIPELACPNQCIYCNQRNISGQNNSPSIEEVEYTIENHLKTIDFKNNYTEIGFFGGNFTGIDVNMQIDYLKKAFQYIEKGFVKSIRLSTRPDYIDQDKLNVLKLYGVKTIELGVQSTDKDVLIKSDRGYSPKDIHDASVIIKNNGFDLGLQMMIGLPEDNYKKAIKTAETIISLKADCTRIYPTLVIKDTKLKEFYEKNLYKPLSINKAVIICKEITLLFERANIPIIKMGLHPSEGLINKTNLIAGPFHLSFRELVYTAIWNDIFKNNIDFSNSFNKIIHIEVASEQFNYAIGYSAYNKNKLSKRFKKVYFKANKDLLKRKMHVSYS
ncbi:MAG: hypothetical protein A2X12_02730 [Bacteroidetes bacterium GWE2_29_8]|nr:MAG: hypothetical protein A2X12_02730 [Bacteroidetes bacterium GWE2_29_8]OFY20089.1 MAG: hypothetical protein A2X02_06925 [Bacteroidetes bacterium GWF2_29_10]